MERTDDEPSKVAPPTPLNARELLSPSRLLKSSGSYSHVMMESTGSLALELATGAHEDSSDRSTCALESTESHLPVHVRFKRVVILCATTAVVGVTSVLMALCVNDGLRVDSFESTAKDDQARKELLDSYNSYSGNVVSLVTKPLELFLAMVVAVGLLCFATTFSVQASVPRTRFTYTLAGLSALAGYLFTNGFNAVNVQLAPRPVDSVITPYDLSFAAAEHPEKERANSYSDAEPLPFKFLSNRGSLEETTSNSLTNTILRNALVPIEQAPNATQCQRSEDLAARQGDAAVIYGFPSRPWHAHALTTAPEPTWSLKIAVSDASAQAPRVLEHKDNSGTKSNSRSNATTVAHGDGLLPMETERAIQLLVQTIAMTQAVLPWWNYSYVMEAASDVIKKQYRPIVAQSLSDRLDDDVHVATLSRLLFSAGSSNGTAATANSSSSTETIVSPSEFLVRAKQMLFSMFRLAPNASATDVRAEFARTRTIAHGVTFDSLTLEVPLRKRHLHRELYANTQYGEYEYRYNASAAADGHYYYDLSLLDDCSRDACIVSEPEYSYDRKETFIDAQVQALAVCLNDDGREDPTLRFQYRNESANQWTPRVVPTFVCRTTSKQSMYSISVGKRIEAEAMSTHEVRDVPNTVYPRMLRLKNARKVYSITVTLVSWELQDLAAQYNAQCRDGDCRGLAYALEPPRDVAKRQYLVVGASRLPLVLLNPYNPPRQFLPEIARTTRFMPLVSMLVRRPSEGNVLTRQSAGDLMAPRRVAESETWPLATDATTPNCSSRAEHWIHHVASNHLYIEHSLQPSIAAAFFFLFQDAVVRGVLASNMTSTGTSSRASDAVVLDFVGNVQWIDVTLSSPLPNVVLTLVGAALLLILSIGIALCGGRTKETELQRLWTPHSVAELLINERKYPSLLLEKRVALLTSLSDSAAAATTGTEDVSALLEQFQIRRLVLVDSTDETRAEVALSMLLLALGAAMVLLLEPTDAAHRIGVGKADITGPAAEVVMMGYADSNQKSAGILNRLYARAFIVEDSDTQTRVVFVNSDLAAVFQLVHQEVIKQLGVKYNGVYTAQNVVLHATHTHAGPGGSSAYFLYDVSIFGYINENFDVIVSGILAAIDAAHRSLAPGTIHFNKGTIVNGGKNRSPLAYAANPATERAQYAFDHDTDLRLLQFRDPNGALRGVLGFFPVHPTSLTQKNKLVSGDNKGYAEFLLEDKYPGVIAGIGISNAADVSPNLIDNGNGTFRGEGATDVESAEIIGKRQADKVVELLSAPSALVTGSVLGRLAYVDFSNVKLQGRVATPSEPYADRTCPAIVGQNFGAGTEDGRGLDAFTEGNLKANPLFRAIGAVIKEPPAWVKDCQTVNKVPLLATGLMSPVPWTPEILPVQVVKIGQFGLAVTNFEVSTMAGRRIRSTVLNALAPAGVTEVEVASISNAYAQYLTTKEEYSKQNYEGASTLFGPNQLAALQQELARVAAAVVDPSTALDVGLTPRQFDRSKLLNFQTGVVMDTVPWGKSFGALRADVRATYAVGSTVSATFYGAHPKNRLQSVASFCDVEQDVNGKFVTVLTDAHWDVRYRWSRNGISESNSVCEWVVRPGSRTSVPGRYRIRHRGFSKPLIGAITAYEGVSSVFQVQ